MSENQRTARAAAACRAPLQLPSDHASAGVILVLIGLVILAIAATMQVILG